MPGGLRTQILFLSLLPPLAIALVLGIYLAYSHLRDLQNYTQARGQALTIQLGITAQQALLDQDLAILRQLSDASLEESGVRAISFFDPQGRQLSHSGPLLKLPPSAADFAAGKSLQRTEDNIDVFFAPVYRQLLTSNLHNGLPSGNHALLGWIAVEYNRNDIVIQKHHRLLMQNILIMLALLLSGLLGIRLAQRIANDIRILNNSVKRIKEGESGDPEAVSSSREMQQLANNIRDMAKHLQNEFNEMRHNLELSTNDLKETIETMEIQNIELGLAKKEALTASKIKSEFLANTSHEIRTPLNGIVGFAKILKKTSLNKQQHEYVDTIHRSSENLLTIINDILDFSKIEAGKLELELAPFNLRQLMEECLNLFAPQAYEKNIEMVLMIYQDVPLHIVGDALRIKQIVSNLLSNAVKFTHQGTIALRVSLEHICDDQAELGISVSDSGIGMTALQQKNIFQAFTQANSSISREYGGTGLGLAIVKRLVELMHDEIRVESRPNQGSTFSFVLKAQIAEHQHGNHFQELHKRTVLVFEKHELLNLAIKHLLSSWSVNVLSATSSTQAGTLLAEHYVDLIIVGLSQVHDYGVQADEIESLSRHSKPLLLLTSSQAEKQIRQLYHGSPFISYKPVTETRLYQNIVDILYPHKNRLPRLAQKTARHGDLLQVLAVDDHQPNLKLLNILLHDLGCKVSNAADGREAIDMCKQQVFDIIFMDIQMPVINGLNATRAIREEESLNNNTPIIALTAHAMADERDAIFKTGMNDYLTKPVNEEQLLASISKWCEPRNTAAESVDVALCLKLANYKHELACELFALLAESLPAEMEKITSALEQDDEQLLEHVHRLHGACCYTGVPALKSAAQRFEFAIKNSDKAQYPALLDHLASAATAIVHWHQQNDFSQQLLLLAE